MYKCQGCIFWFNVGGAKGKVTGGGCCSAVPQVKFFSKDSHTTQSIREYCSPDAWGIEKWQPLDTNSCSKDDCAAPT